MPGALALGLDAAGRLCSLAILAVSILRGGSPLLFLWGLWIDEVLSLAGASLRAGRRAAALRLFGIFPAAHLVFVVFFSAIGATGLFGAPGAPRMALPSARDALLLSAGLALRTAIDLVRAGWRRRRGGREDAAAVEREAKLAIFLPHLTIIAGGFCLLVFRLAHWLSWGILAGRAIFEAAAFAAGSSRGAAASDTRPASPPAAPAAREPGRPPTASGRGTV